MIELVVIGMLNALCFWKRPVYILIPVSMIDVIYGLIYGISGGTTPIYNSTKFWEGLVIVILGLSIFIYEFVWIEVLKKILSGEKSK